MNAVSREVTHEHSWHLRQPALGLSNTARLHVARELLPAGATLAIFDLHGLPLFDLEVEAQGDPAPVAALKDAVAQVDAWLRACPEYNGGIISVLKNAIDWISRPGVASAVVEPQGEVLVFQAHTKIIGGRLADEHTREPPARHLHDFLGALA